VLWLIGRSFKITKHIDKLSIIIYNLDSIFTRVSLLDNGAQEGINIFVEKRRCLMKWTWPKVVALFAFLAFVLCVVLVVLAGIFYFADTIIKTQPCVKSAPIPQSIPQVQIFHERVIEKLVPKTQAEPQQPSTQVFMQQQQQGGNGNQSQRQGDEESQRQYQQQKNDEATEQSQSEPEAINIFPPPYSNTPPGVVNVFPSYQGPGYIYEQSHPYSRCYPGRGRYNYGGGPYYPYHLPGYYFGEPRYYHPDRHGPSPRLRSSGGGHNRNNPHYSRPASPPRPHFAPNNNHRAMPRPMPRRAPSQQRHR